MIKFRVSFVRSFISFCSLAAARLWQKGLKIPVNATLPEISDAHYVSLQTSVNFPRTRPLKCMEQTAFLFNLNQERTEMKNSFQITVKHIISYALFMK